MSWKLIKIDKNGTKYYASNVCQRCGGAGGADEWVRTGWTCYECGGTGISPKTTIYKEYTPEYQAKLEERRLARARKKAPEINAKFFKKLGMDEEGKAWIVLGNTYEIKDQLKEAGAKYGDLLGWHFDHKVEDYDCFELNISDIADKDENIGTWQLFDDWWVRKIIKQMRLDNAPKTESQWIGSVGDKLELDVTFCRYFTFETHFTYYGELNYIYKFADASGNTVVWKTSKDLELEEGKNYKIKGTVKELSEYKGDKQTVLTRCKIA